VTASRPLQVATRFFERHSRQRPRRFGFGRRNWPCSLHQGRWADGRTCKNRRVKVFTALQGRYLSFIYVYTKFTLGHQRNLICRALPRDAAVRSSDGADAGQERTYLTPAGRLSVDRGARAAPGTFRFSSSCFRPMRIYESVATSGLASAPSIHGKPSSLIHEAD
jgi:hypothetical protein